MQNYFGTNETHRCKVAKECEQTSVLNISDRILHALCIVPSISGIFQYYSEVVLVA